MEGIAFQVYDLVKTMERASHCPITALRVDGGASASEFMMQFEADLLGITVTRPENVETTALGAAYMAEVARGKLTIERLKQLSQKDSVFVPHMAKDERDAHISRWNLAVSSIRSFR